MTTDAETAHALRAALLRPAVRPPSTTALLGRLWMAVRPLLPVGGAALRGSRTSPSSRDDEALLRAFAAGEVEAFEALAARHLGRLKGYAMRTLSEADAEDAVQEALLVVFRQASTLTGRGAFQRYAFGALTIEIQRAQRRAMRARSRTAPQEELGDVADEAPLPEATWLRRQSIDALTEAFLALLEPLDQQLLLLWIEGDASSAEVGAAVGMDPTTVRVRQHRALRRLRAWFAERGGVDG